MNLPLTQYRNLFGVYLRPQRARVALLAVLLLAVTVLQLWSPQLLRQFIDAAAAADAPPRTLLTLAALFLVAALATQAVQVSATYVSELVGWTATNRLRSDLARHCLGLDRAFHNQRTAGEMIERVDGDVTALSTFFSQLVLQVFGSLLLLTGVLVALFWESTLVGATLTLFALASLTALMVIRTIAVQDMAEEREARASMFGLIEERLAGLDDVRANGGGDYAIQRLDDVTRVVRRTGTRAAIRSSWIWITTIGIFTLGYALALGLGAFLFFRAV
jgi:ATP-binding cassette subfamily B protein